MDVAFDADHYFRPEELPGQWCVSRSLAVVPFAIDLGERVNIVCHGIGVRDPKHLAGLNTDDAWMKPAAALVESDGRRGYFELFFLRARL